MEPWRQYGGFYRMVDFTTSWTYDTPLIETRTVSTLPVPPIESIGSITTPHPSITPATGPIRVESCSYLASDSESPPRGAETSWRGSLLLGSSTEAHPRRRRATSLEPGGNLETEAVGLGLQFEPAINTGGHDLTDEGDEMGVLGLGLVGLAGETPLDSPSPSRVQYQSTSATAVPTTAVTGPASIQKRRKKPFRFVKKWFSSVKSGFGKRRRIIQVENLESGGPSVLTQTPTVLSLKPFVPPPVSRSSLFVDQLQEQQVEDQDQEWKCDENGTVQDCESVDWSRPLTLREWKAWGYYARPWINGVFVNNYPPDPGADAGEISDTEIERLAEGLIDENGNEHPEIWIAGVQHPSLPPRPPRWLSDPAPYWSGQCELNPYLRRKLVGEPPLFWDMGKDPSTAVHGHNLIATPLLPPDRAQPATWPITTHFFISALADDVEFRWPVLIRNKHGVTVQDVLEWIYANFQEAVDCDEWATWPVYLRTIATISYDKRGERDYLKRIDYLGFHSMFRGFEHSPDGQSWYLYVGRPY